MPDELQTAMTRMYAYIQRCLQRLETIAETAPDLEFLQTFLTNAKGYLAGDLSPDTEAMENWGAPENQAMIRRYLIHVEQQIRLIAEDWQAAQGSSATPALRASVAAILADLDQFAESPDADGLRPTNGQNGHG